jgi:Domain of unknown function (DUF6089)
MKKRSYISSIITLVMFTANCLNGLAQQTTDIGITLGTANYWGDIQGITLSKNVTPFSGILTRLNVNSHSAFRLQLLSGQPKGDGKLNHALIGQPKNSAVVFANDLNYNYNFNRSFKNIELLYEFNLLNYKLGHTKKENFTPFIACGFGVMYSQSPKKGSFILEPDPSTIVRSMIGPPFVFYPPYRSSNGHQTNEAAIFTLTFPAGGGFKINLTERLNVIAEVMIHPTLSDNLDNLRDPQRFQNPSSTQVGYLPANISFRQCDLYTTLSISISYQIYSTERHKIKIWNRPRKI